MSDKNLWESSEVAKAVKGKATGDFSAIGVSIDSRSIVAGELFVAITGDQMDGHDFVEAAFKNGAAAAIVRKGFETSSGKPLVHVDDCFKALENLGRAGRDRSTAKIVAVTGSAGKTGTKELMTIALSKSGNTYSSKKSFNNHWGVPLSLANMPLDTEFGIFELGMNHEGEIRELVKQVRPHIAVITTVEPVHIEFFKNEEGIADAKAEIFTAMEGEKIAVLNIDNPHYKRLCDKAKEYGVKKIYSFGEDEAADCLLQDCLLRPDHVKVTAKVMGEPIKYKINIPGKHIALNSLSVMAVVKILGGDINKAVSALRSSEPINGRGNRIKIKIKDKEPEIIIIDETFNANPASMRAAFQVFAITEPVAGGRRIAVLGDMLELGKEGPKLHQELANPLLKTKVDKVLCCGPLMEAMYNMLPSDWHGGWAKNSYELAELVLKEVKPGDVLLIKGSKGSKMPYIIQALQQIEVKG